jgi:hypothetical protein
MLKSIQPYRWVLLPIAFGLAVLPACLLGLLVVKYSVNVPFQDQWAIARLLPKWVEGTLSFGDLFAQHNESRKFFPRLIFLTLAQFTHWDVRYEMLVSFLLAGIVAVNLYRLSRLTLFSSQIQALLLAAIANLIIFSPVQWDNWLWGIQVVVFIPIACITTAISVCYSQLRLNTKFAICLGLAIVSTFSYANGILYWAIVLPVLFGSWRDWLAHKRLVLAWGLSFAIACLAYFYNYQKPSQTPSFTYALLHPLEAANYFLAFLGTPLGFGNALPTVLLASVVGLAILLLVGVIGLYFYKHRTVLVYSNRGWLMLGTYSLLSASITTLGRVGFGIEQATSSRYTTFSLYLLIALIHLIPIAISHAWQQGYLNNWWPRVKVAIAALIAILLVLHFQTAAFSIQMMGYTRTSRLQGKACLLLIDNFVDEDCLRDKISPRVSVVRDRIHPINKYGFLQPPLVTSKIAEDISDNGQGDYGYFDSLHKTGGSYIATGWAILPQKHESADAVILTYRDADNKSIVFAVVDNQFPRDDIAKAYGKSAYLNSGWQTQISLDKLPLLPKRKLEVSAWAFDTDTGKAFKLNGQFALSNSKFGMRSMIQKHGIYTTKGIHF